MVDMIYEGELVDEPQEDIDPLEHDMRVANENVMDTIPPRHRDILRKIPMALSGFNIYPVSEMKFRAPIEKIEQVLMRYAQSAGTQAYQEVFIMAVLVMAYHTKKQEVIRYYLLDLAVTMGVLKRLHSNPYIFLSVLETAIMECDTPNVLRCYFELLDAIQSRIARDEKGEE